MDKRHLREIEVSSIRQQLPERVSKIKAGYSCIERFVFIFVKELF